MTQVKLRVDIRNGTVEVEAGGDTFALAMDRAESILDKFSKIDLRPATSEEASDSGTETESSENTEASEEEPTLKAKKKRSSSSSRSTSWKMVDLLVEEKRKVLRDFFEQKNPNSQNEKVAVLSHKLKELTGREGFDGNEIYTAFQIVGQKTPGNLNAVFGNMTGLGLGSVVDKKFRPNFKADDLVKHDLPVKAAKK